MIKALASLVLSLCFCLPGWAAKNDASLDANAIAEEIRNAIRDLQIQIPELFKDIRINVQIPDLELQIPEIEIRTARNADTSNARQRPLGRSYTRNTDTRNTNSDSQNRHSDA